MNKNVGKLVKKMATIVYSSHHRTPLLTEKKRYSQEEPAHLIPNSKSRLFSHCTKQKTDMIGAFSKSAPNLAQNFFFSRQDAT